MIPWTDTAKRWARVACRKFEGTPHVNRICLPGEGVDCINFVAAVVVAAGIVPQPKFPFYDERLGSLRQRNIMEAIILEHCYAETHPPTTEPEFGDVVICLCGRQTNHTGIIVDGKMWHVPAKGFVSGEPWEEWRSKAQALVRIVATGYKRDPDKLTWEQVKTRADLPL